jgi:hypothetical protein
MAELAGWSYADLLQRILVAAQERVVAERERRSARPALVAPPRRWRDGDAA